MFSIIFVSLIAPIIVGVILMLFSYWLNKRDR
nr:type I toxin-antitoxin system Fst family toxin [Staphylococcus xylosus]